jgi:hypothetical protein
MSEDIRFEVPPDIVVRLLQERATKDPLLAAHLDAASWQAAAIHLRQQQEKAKSLTAAD